MDPDRTPPQAELRWLIDECRVEEESIRGTTLESVGAKFASAFGEGPKLRWVVPVGNRNQDRFGPAYCPKCLAEDETPYFRLSWRFAFMVHCERHQTLLSDSCPHCGKAVWPAILRGGFPNWHGFAVCSFCRGQLSDDSDVPQKNASLSRELWKCATTGVIPPSIRQAETAKEVFSALWALCQLLLRNRSAHAWKYLPREGAIPEFIASQNQKSGSIELLPLSARAKTLRGAHWLLQDWPSRLSDFAKTASISRHHFSTDAREHQPHWFAEVVEAELSRKTRGITHDQVKAAISKLETTGQSVTKLAVRRALEVSEAKAINDLLSQRRQATVGELMTLCGKFEHRLANGPVDRDQRRTLLRDYLIVLLAVISERPVESVCSLTRVEIDALPPTLKLRDSVAELLFKRAKQLNECYGSIRAEFGVNPDVTAWFVSRFGTSLAGHSVRERVAKMMRVGFSDALWRSVDVFTNGLAGEDFCTTGLMALRRSSSSDVKNSS